ncbi:MAG: hypothetical protein Q7S21_07470 [archaeon]|nr:hypothetical protein [archaeon]
MRKQPTKKKTSTKRSVRKVLPVFPKEGKPHTFLQQRSERIKKNYFKAFEIFKKKPTPENAKKFLIVALASEQNLRDEISNIRRIKEKFRKQGKKPTRGAKRFLANHAKNLRFALKIITANQKAALLWHPYLGEWFRKQKKAKK